MRCWLTIRRACLLTVLPAGLLAGCFNYSNVFPALSTGDFLRTGQTLSHFIATQVDPRSEDSAGPQFVTAGDLNGDGLIDLVSAWNQSQPVQIHLQHRDGFGQRSFETLTLAGNVSAVRVSGLDIADLDLDGHPDIVVLVQESLLEGAGCLSGDGDAQGSAGVLLTYLGPDDPATANQALAWEEVTIGTSFLIGGGTPDTLPEIAGYTSMSIGDVDSDGDDDIAVAWSGPCQPSEVLLFTNRRPSDVRDGTWNVEIIPSTVPGLRDRGTVRDVALADIDRDGDLDMVVTHSGAESLNIRWLRNPVIDVEDDFHISDGEWQVGTVGQIDSDGRADIIELGDIDQDGLIDIVMRSTKAGLIQWLKAPPGPTTLPVRNIPWQVYTLAEFTNRPPQALSLGDMNNDGQLDVIASAGGGLAWFNGATASSVYDQWSENLIIDDDPPADPASPATDPGVNNENVAAGSTINSIFVVDLDQDGSLDLLVTLDRTGLSGLTNDALVWFRNTHP